MLTASSSPASVAGEASAFADSNGEVRATGLWRITRPQLDRSSFGRGYFMFSVTAGTVRHRAAQRAAGTCLAGVTICSV